MAERLPVSASIENVLGYVLHSSQRCRSVQWIALGEPLSTVASQAGRFRQRNR